jgi:hypothetical protein
LVAWFLLPVSVIETCKYLNNSGFLENGQAENL